jgi:hypothetical protein
MQQKWSRPDLTGRALGDIGRLALVVPFGLREKEASVTCAMILKKLISLTDKIISRLHALRDPDELESIVVQRLELFQKDLGLLDKNLFTLERDSDYGRTVYRLRETGEGFYEDRFDSEDPPDNLKDIADELRTLQELVRVYGPANPLVIHHAKWLASGISLLFHNGSRLPRKVPARIQDQILATMTLLDTIDYRDQRDCLDSFAETILLLNGFNQQQKADDDTPPPLQEDDSSNSLKERFTFRLGQALFDNIDLKVPSGEPLTMLEKLVETFGHVVAYTTFDKLYNSATPGTLPKSVTKIRKTLKTCGIPCEIKSKTGKGYLIRRLEVTPKRKKRVRKKE